MTNLKTLQISNKIRAALRSRGWKVSGEGLELSAILRKEAQTEILQIEGIKIITGLSQVETLTIELEEME
jgi:hypothetical protein